MRERRHPDWLKVALPRDENFNKVSQLMKQHGLFTVCREARCPNQSECYSCGTATFLIMGGTCTRNCRYCNIDHGHPAPLDENEPLKIARAIKVLGLNYAVITSVTRDDLPDQGADHFYKTITAIRDLNPDTKIEILTPDFQNNPDCIKHVASAKPYVFNHNIEVAHSLFSRIRPEGCYQRSIRVLKTIKSIDPDMLTKSGLMVGLGETDDEIIETINDLRRAGVDILTVGQYLQPRKDLEPIVKYYEPSEFDRFREYALRSGFKQIFSGPLVRSSYHAKDILQ